MPTMAWFHSGADPFLSGELRLLGLPALLAEGRGWRCDFRPVTATGGPPTDVVVVSADTLDAIAVTGRWPRPPALLLNLECDAIGRDAEQLAAVRLAAGRLDAVVARGPISARWAQDNLRDRTACHLIPDVADRLAELRAAALRFSLFPSLSTEPPPCDLFWLAEPGDPVDADEIEAVVAAATATLAAGQRMVLAAPAQTLDWLRQAALPAATAALPWSPGLADGLLRSDAALFLPEGETSTRRRAKAQRYWGGAAAHDLAGHAPAAAAVRWRAVATACLSRPPAPAATGPITLLVFLDLIQDVELALPVLRVARARPGVMLRVAATEWLRDNNPRLQPALAALGIVPEFYDRRAVAAGGAVPLDGVHALLTVVETTLNPHKRAHVLTLEAQARGIATFTTQHGLENVGLTYFDDVHDRSVDIRSDHVFAWFPPDRVPPGVPARVRPRLLHVGRPRMEQADAPPLPNHPGTRLIAVFENLHWDRYSRRFRERFLEDCFRLAEALEDTVVVIKPHPAGRWLTKTRDTIEAWPVNVLVADPEDPLWHGTSAASLVEIADAVITTPSSVAVDTALEGRRVAVAGYDLDVSAYAPLPILRSFDDWLGFATSRDTGARAAMARARFLGRIDMAGPSEERMVDAIQGALARSG